METFLHEATNQRTPSSSVESENSPNCSSNATSYKLVKKRSSIQLNDNNNIIENDIEEGGIFLANAINDNDLSTFNSLPTNLSVDIRFENITYVAEQGGILQKKEQKEILHEINGLFPAGQLIAIMGPSGAGKSTLLNILSGYSIQGVGGTVQINGKPRKLKSFRKMSCYITQDDSLQQLLTVKENMHIAADLKLPSYINEIKKQNIITEILNTLRLKGTENTLARGLSGGQKRRLSIALEMVNNPLVMFLDEPTSGLDSSSCRQCITLLKDLAKQGRTIVCTIHQPSASLFQMFDQVYVLSQGKCLYQGDTQKILPFFEDVGYPCPKFHNPADYVIEIASDPEESKQQILKMIETSENGRNLHYFQDNLKILENIHSGNNTADDDDDDLQATSKLNQLKVLMKRGLIKMKRDQTLTYMRIGANIITALMLGTLYYNAGTDGSKVIDNYNLMFSILMHNTFTPMMLTILTFPTELSILIKEHFNRWYSLKMYYLSLTLTDIPLSMFCCSLFTSIVYFMTAQPFDTIRVVMFFVSCMLVVFVAESFGLAIGAYFSVVNGTFLGPILTVPMMMFAGFGVSLRDMPMYLYWGSYISYLRFGLEGVVGAIYGLDRPTIDCPEDAYCHYRYPKKFLEDIAVRSDQFSNDVIALVLFWFILRIAAMVILKYKLRSLR